jgi:heat-inducible transcriptional repressor
MLEERKAAILKAVVEEYIETAQPVGSSHVAPNLGVSSATVRNEMVQLEKQGFLHQPHTSAGRVPTDKGYRFFVDSLSGVSEPGASPHEAQVHEFFDHAHGELERLLSHTTRLLSDLTDLAAVVVAPATPAAMVRSVQVVRIGMRSAIAVAVLSTGAIDKATIELADDVTDAVVDRAGALLSAHLLGSTVCGSGPMAAVAPSDKEASTLAALMLGALAAAEPDESDQVYVGGTARMAAAFDAVETVQSVLTILERQLVVVSLIRDVLNRGLTVAIGSENGVDTLAECSLVVAPYEVEGEVVGTIGVIGPTRMNYPQALSAVAVVSKRLGDRLSEG